MSNSKIIWDFLKKEGFSDFGVAGLMGNLDAESALRPNNLQDTYSRSLGLSDAEYTAKVDNGTYTNLCVTLQDMAWLNGLIGLVRKIY